jgi:hypothetical protein
MAKDLVIGAVTDYEYDRIAPWLQSLKQTGYEGNIALVAYNMSEATITKLTEEGVTYIFGFGKDEKNNFVYSNKKFSIMIERFAHMWYFIDQIKDDLEFVIATDVRDVIFQTNPSEWLYRNTPFCTRIKRLVVGSENLKYQDEPWGKNNMMQAFGPILYEKCKDLPIYCAGVIAGEKRAILDLFMNIFLMCRGAPSEVPGGGGPDQAALNILLSFDAFRKQTRYSDPEDDFVIHAGTTTHAIKSGSGDIGFTYMHDPSVLHTYESKLLHREPVMIDGQVCTYDGLPYCIVHQWDRVNEWREIIEKKYRS